MRHTESGRKREKDLRKNAGCSVRVKNRQPGDEMRSPRPILCHECWDIADRRERGCHCQCSDCGSQLRVRNPAATTYTATCPSCYDGTEDSHPRSRVMGVGASGRLAINAWHEARKATDE